MAKVRCPCGAVLHDQTDFISYKARLVPDQDVEDLAGKIEQQPDDTYGFLLRESRELFHCEECSRLILFLDDGVHYFSADEPEKSKRVLRSIHGEMWKRTLRARWANGAGSLSWGFGVDDEGYEDVSTWEELSTSYYEVFDRLLANDVLRSAMLTRDGSREHLWPPKSDDGD